MDTQDLSSAAEIGNIGVPIGTPTGKLPLRQIGDWFVLEIRGKRDIPEYDEVNVGRGLGEQAFRREVLGDWTATEGKVVYPEYGLHNVSLEPLEFNPNRPLICGWDLPAGTGGTPAFVPCQLSMTGQLYVWEALVPREDQSIGLWEFADQVAHSLYQRFAVYHGLKIRQEPRLKTVHYGDPAGRQKPPKTANQGNASLELRSAFDVLERGQAFVTGTAEDGNPIVEERPGWGWKVQPGEVSLAKRMEALRSLCQIQPFTGIPGIVLDPAAIILQEGLGGGYHYKQRNDGRYELDPAKNYYSHPCNALEYVASRLGNVWSPEEEADEEQPRFVPSVRGAGRRRR